jgi:proline iminopeptidase
VQRSDRAAWGRYRVQAHYLAHRGFVRPGELDRAVASLARERTPVDWVHGRFDAICPPANSARWAAQGRQALHTPPAGHLGGEPAMLACLRACVRRSLS